MAHSAFPSQKSSSVAYLCPEGAAGAKMVAGVRVGTIQNGRGVGVRVGVGEWVGSGVAVELRVGELVDAGSVVDGESDVDTTVAVGQAVGIEVSATDAD